MKNIKQFEVVMEIARSGSISKAAEVLNVKQPTLSKFLLKCESDLGFELFDRTTIPIKLTPAGERFINAGQKIIDAYHQLEKEIADAKNNKKSIVKIGISNSRAPYMLPKILKRFSEECPDCKIIIKEDTTSNLVNELYTGSLDLIISLLSDGTRNFLFENLFNETILLACPKTLEHLDVLDIIKNKPLINSCKGQRMWNLTNMIINEVGSIEPVIECKSIGLGMSFVNKGLGSMLAPSYFAKDNKYENVVFKELPINIKNIVGSEIERKVCVFYRKKQFLTTGEKKFIEICKKNN